MKIGNIFKIKGVYKHPLTVDRIESNSIRAKCDDDKIKYWFDNDSIEYYKSIGKFKLLEKEKQK